jgi:hypothetical protein
VGAKEKAPAVGATGALGQNAGMGVGGCLPSITLVMFNSNYSASGSFFEGKNSVASVG